MYLNRAQIYGNLTKSPELKALPSRAKVCSFSVATNRVYKDANGNKKEEAEFHNVVVFGKQAETSAMYLKKGQGVLIEGRIQTRSWDDKTSGEKKYRTEIIAESVQFGPKVGGSTQENERKTVSSEEISNQVNSGVDYGDENVNLDDIPF